jgi:DNA-binding PadR family transcriptional regulator
MKKYQLGEFEEVVLLTIAVLNNEAYSVSIKDEIESRLKRTVSLGALHTALKRMEDKGYLRSYPGDTNEDRAGRPKRYFEITAMGKKAMHYAKDTRDDLWRSIPKTVWQLDKLILEKP